MDRCPIWSNSKWLLENKKDTWPTKSTGIITHESFWNLLLNINGKLIWKSVNVTHSPTPNRVINTTDNFG